MSAAREVLDEFGFETQTGRDDELILKNCPFDSAAERDPEIVCALNEALVSGVLDGVGCRAVTETRGRTTSRCCVVVHTRT